MVRSLRMMRGQTLVRVVLTAGWLGGAVAGGQLAGGFPMIHERPTASEVLSRVVERNAERLAVLERYTTVRTYQVHYSGTGGEHKAELKVTAEYTGPEQKRLQIISESGSKFICEKVLRKLVEGEQEASDRSNRMQSALTPENYNATLVGEEMIAPFGSATPIETWVLEVAPKTPSKFTYKGRVWISQDDYAVVRVAGEPAKSPSWWIDRAHFESSYVRRGPVWLPGRNVSSSHVRIGGEATLTIEYGSYPVVVAGTLKPASTEASLRLQ